MKRIEEIIKLKYIELEEVKVKFTVKLLQYELNKIIFKYKQKYGFNEYISLFIEELTNKVKNSQPYKEKDKEVEELLSKTREIIITLRKYQQPQDTIKLEMSVDNMLRYLLYNYGKNKGQIKLYEQIEVLNELKIIKSIIEKNNIDITPRIKNSYKLIEQLQNNIIKIIKE